jgi:glutamine amidotransferase
MIAIVDYKAGNLASVRLAFESLKVEVAITNSPDMILSADRVVFPGVGAAGAAMKNLADMNLLDALKASVARGTPFLGICLGTQIMLDRSEEDGGVNCLGLIPGTVKLFKPPDRRDKVPQMGWNNVVSTRPHPMFDGVKNGSEFYFVHSYYPAPSDKRFVVGETEYAGVRFASVIGRNNCVAVQFHPERSGRVGLRLLDNFSRWDGKC